MSNITFDFVSDKPKSSPPQFCLRLLIPEGSLTSKSVELSVVCIATLAYTSPPPCIRATLLKFPTVKPKAYPFPKTERAPVLIIARPFGRLKVHSWKRVLLFMLPIIDSLF